MEIISRADALSAGKLYYFTGKPCKRGHVAKRLVSNWGCYTCSLESSRTWHRANPQVFQRSKYQITQRELDSLDQSQAHACATCLEPFTQTYHVDHDHATGKVRGLLCKRCNWALGHALDNPATLRRMADYLER